MSSGAQARRFVNSSFQRTSARSWSGRYASTTRLNRSSSRCLKRPRWARRALEQPTGPGRKGGLRPWQIAGQPSRVAYSNRVRLWIFA